MCSENKGADQLRGNREAGLRFCFRLCRLPVFLMWRLILSFKNLAHTRCVKCICADARETFLTTRCSTNRHVQSRKNARCFFFLLFIIYLFIFFPDFKGRVTVF